MTPRMVRIAVLVGRLVFVAAVFGFGAWIGAATRETATYESLIATNRARMWCAQRTVDLRAVRSGLEAGAARMDTLLSAQGWMHDRQAVPGGHMAGEQGASTASAP